MKYNPQNINKQMMLFTFFWNCEPDSKSDVNLDAVMQLLIDLRNNARKEKNFALADEIRDKLAQPGH